MAEQSTPRNIVDMTEATDRIAFGLFLADIRRTTSQHGMGVTDADVRTMWDRSTPLERYHWQDLARPLALAAAVPFLAQGWDSGHRATLIATEHHAVARNPWRTDA